MAQPYIGEIRMFAGNFAPAGWMLCQGQLLPISENETLFALIGTTYGGDGQSTFALPDLQSRVPIHMGGGMALAQTGGVESVTLTTAQIAAHDHTFNASTATAGGINPAGNVVGQSDSVLLFRAQAGNTPLQPSAIAPAGGSQPHDNMQPFLCLNFIISLFGIFPSQT